jgi:hypothetical protein
MTQYLQSVQQFIGFFSFIGDRRSAVNNNQIDRYESDWEINEESS